MLKLDLFEDVKDLRGQRMLTFQQHDKPKPATRAAMEMFRSNHIHVIECARKSPDRNQIQNLCKDLKHALHSL